MRNIQEIINILEGLKDRLSSEFGVKEIAVFGSYTKGKASSLSDIDILVDFYEDPSLITFLKLKYFLTDCVGIPVDLVMKSTLKPSIGKYIVNEAIKI